MENKKNRKVLKIILIIALVLLAILVIHTVRNYIIIDEIAKKQELLSQKTNYYFISEHYDTSDENDRTILEHYTKDDINMMSRKLKGETIVIWGDKKEKETITMSPTKLTATVSKPTEVLTNYIPLGMGIDSTHQKIMFAMLSFISTNKVNEKECYEISIPSVKLSIDKENGTVLKNIAGKVVKDGKEYSTVTEYKDYKFDTITDEDVTRPNLIGYNVKYENNIEETNSNS